jgi:predicted phosphoribosyltransferase
MVAQADIVRELAAELRAYRGRTDVYAIAIVPESLWLAAEVAQQLRVPFDVFPVRAVPGTSGQGPPVGIVASGGVLILDRAAVAEQGYSVASLAEAAQTAGRALVEFEQELRNGAEPPDLRASTIILLDDGRTPIQILRMAITALRRCWVRGTVLALPTISVSELRQVIAEVDLVVSAVVPDDTASVEATIRPAPASVALESA